MTGQYATLTEKSKSNTYLLGLLYVLGGSLFIALAAQIRIPLPFTPIPMTMQTLAVMLVGATLGSRLGALAVIAYLLEAACGLPFFATPQSIVAVGYLAGFVIQAFLTGLFFEQKKNFSGVKTLLALSVISALQLAIGAAWLGLFVDWSLTIPMGVTPFMLGEMIKAGFATAIIKNRN